MSTHGYDVGLMGIGLAMILYGEFCAIRTKVPLGVGRVVLKTLTGDAAVKLSLFFIINGLLLAIVGVIAFFNLVSWAIAGSIGIILSLVFLVGYFVGYFAAIHQDKP